MARAEHPIDLPCSSPSPPDLDQRSDHDADLVSQETVPVEVEMHLVIRRVADPQLPQRAAGMRRSTTARPKTAEVVGAHQELCASAHRNPVQRRAEPPRPARTEATPGLPKQEPVPVVFFAGPAPGVETIRRGLHGEAADVGRQQRTKPSLQRLRRARRCGGKSHDLCTGMDARVGAPGRVDSDGLSTEDLPKRFLDRLLEGTAARLALPAHVGTAVPGEDGTPGPAAGSAQ